ncbi:phage portal protein [Streptomyces sp. SHP 1-2]|uniref:phage portal protein n=1 Tax=Streptomyces sp. SHP 1-2 TaxID=2769489 RepID=UPI0022389250|nr:phage portal protein [Streptomyces sp. SHP 1-2]MCW5252221.1 phage portal protein [Streptomyces sp. SHP 1-2]
MSLFGLFERRAPSLENPAVPLTDAALAEVFGGFRSDAGVPVSEKTSLRTPTVWRAVAVIAGVSAALPLHLYQRGSRDRVESPLLDDPHPELTPLELWRLVNVHRVLWGNGYVQKLRNQVGQVKELWPLTPDRVDVKRDKPSAVNPTGKWFFATDDWGTVHALTPREVLHLPGLGFDGLKGLSPITMARQGIGLAQAAEKGAAKLFGRGNVLSGVLETEQKLNADQAHALKTRFQAKLSGIDNFQEVAVLDAGAAFKPVTMPLKDSQFLESREFQIPEIARMFGVPLFLLMETSKSTSWGTGLEQQAQGWVTFDLAPTWLAPVEQRITKELLPAKQYAHYAVQGLLRGDSSARATFYRAMRDTGVMSANDIRALEELPPIPGPEGDTYLQPTYMAPLGSNPLAGSGGDIPARAAALMAEARRLLAQHAEQGGDHANADDE